MYYTYVAGYEFRIKRVVCVSLVLSLVPQFDFSPEFA